MRENKLREIIYRDCGEEEYLKYSSAIGISVHDLSEAASRTLASIPPTFGSCVMVSAALAAALEVYYSIPAIVVAGDLKINGFDVFKCKNNIPMPTREERTTSETWDGHCWVETDGIICDLSIFRTAYAMEHPSRLKSFILSKYGEGKGALLSPLNDIPQGMEFTPKYVLNEARISGVLGGLDALSKQAI